MFQAQAASPDTPVVVGPLPVVGFGSLPVAGFVPGTTCCQKLGEFMLSGLAGESGMPNSSLRDLSSSKETSLKISITPFGSEGNSSLGSEHFVRCTTIATRYNVATTKK